MTIQKKKKQWLIKKLNACQYYKKIPYKYF
jgi:hypothetical protein